MIKSELSENNFHPKVLIYFCSYCSGPKASSEGLALSHISDSITSVHFKCSREVTPTQLRLGFANGADGILICGCLVRDCTNSPGDLQVLQSLYSNQLTMKNLGLASDRLREEWVVQGTTDHLESIVASFIEHLKIMGPCELSAHFVEPEKMKESQA